LLVAGGFLGSVNFGSVNNERNSTLGYLTQLNLLWAAVSEAAPAEPANQAPGLSAFLPAVLGAMMLYYFLIIRPDRRKQSAHRSNLEALKKNDRVVTIGGIYGVVMNVQRDADEVTLKIDETNNTKIRVTFGSIARIVGDEPASEKPA
jgi:preprotein translocase subunit YajC